MHQSPPWCIFALHFYAFINISISSSTLEIVPIPKFSTNTLATFGERKAGSVGPRCISLTPRYAPGTVPGALYSL